MGTTIQKIQKISETKSEIKSVIEAKGVEVGDIKFADYAEKIQQIGPAKTEDCIVQENIYRSSLQYNKMFVKLSVEFPTLYYGVWSQEYLAELTPALKSGSMWERNDAQWYAGNLILGNSEVNMQLKDPDSKGYEILISCENQTDFPIDLTSCDMQLIVGGTYLNAEEFSMNYDYVKSSPFRLSSSGNVRMLETQRIDCREDVDWEHYRDRKPIEQWPTYDAEHEQIEPWPLSITVLEVRHIASMVQHQDEPV